MHLRRSVAVSLIGLVAAACQGGSDGTPADSLEDVSTVDASRTPPTVFVANQCGAGCPHGQVCAHCFASQVLRCVTLESGGPGRACSQDSQCTSGACVARPGSIASRCADPCDPDAPSSCLVRPFEACAEATSLGGTEGTWCLPVGCGEIGSVCGGEGSCECAAGLRCVVLGSSHGICLPACSEDGECGRGHRCGVDGACYPDGARPATAPCESDEQCAIGHCQAVPGTPTSLCASGCAACGICPLFSGGCDPVPGLCVPGSDPATGVCLFVEPHEPGALCSPVEPCESTTTECVTSVAGRYCAAPCQVQADCDEHQLCMPGQSAGLSPSDFFCMPITDGGVGDCCGPGDDCQAYTLGCALDGGDLRCAMPCEETAQCPAEHTCARTRVGDSWVDKWCLLDPPEIVPEICNGLDDDKDGVVDQGEDGGPLVLPCYEGPTGTIGIGPCQTGTRTCVDGALGPCTGQVLPSADGPAGFGGCNGVDDDCDGGVDEGCPCTFDIHLCGSTLGQCEAGAQLCVNDVQSDCLWGQGTDPVWPTAETCDGVDNDCDGVADNAPGRSEGSLRLVCGTLDPSLDGVGLCRRGSRICDGPCEGEVLPGEEACDGADNDCDGVVDESCPCEADEVAQCGRDAGACSVGEVACAGGAWPEACPGAGPSAELCDGIDNDCDGRIDNTLGSSDAVERPCWELHSDPDSLLIGIGTCAAGHQRCIAGWSTCLDMVGPGVDPDAPGGDLCGDGMDNDCDGQVDEGCPCDNEGKQTLCGADAGVCQTGVQKCEAGILSECVGSFQPLVEVCNGIDDNCDGLVDAVLNEPLPGLACYDGPPATIGLGPCEVGEAPCAGEAGHGDCEAPGPAAEQCNDLDDDCDGVVDEDLPCDCEEGALAACGSSVGACTVGQSVCGGGAWSALCLGAQSPDLEDCNGADDDCDGVVDAHPVSGEAIERPCYDGPALTAGIGACKVGLRQCGDGAWSACVGDVVPLDGDPCDGADNDCDGLIDEGCPCDSGIEPSRPCGLAEGQCEPGVQACDGGAWAWVCAGGQGPTAESCNGEDDDCDGRVDIGLASGLPVSKLCFDGPDSAVDAAPCTAGMRYCTGGVWDDRCLGQHLPALEDGCGNGIDEDCDGVTDQGCP